MDLTEEEVQKILRLIDELDYGEIHLEVGALRIDLVKGPERGQVRIPETSLAESEVAQEFEPDPVLVVPPGAHIVLAPVAGTFYRAPAPGAPPFVEVGLEVEPEDPVGLLEVMKLFNSVPAGVAGRVVGVLAADATAVTEGQPLVAIEPRAAS